MIKLELPPISDDELPYVSIVVPTRNRHHFFDLLMRNWESIDYPRNKLEMIIIDDSDKKFNGRFPIGVNYNYVKRSLTLGQKRNMLCEYASHDYIVHMDDDDWYPKESVVCRIRTMLATKKECFGCQKVQCLDLISNQMFEAYDTIFTVSESTMAYTRKFWSTQKWDNKSTSGECLPFINGRIDQICTAPSSFIVVQFSHTSNTINRHVRQETLMSQLNSDSFQEDLTLYDSTLFNKIRASVIIRIKDYKEALDAINKGIDFDTLSDSLKSNPLILEFKRRSVKTKTTSSGKDIVYYCGPGHTLNFSHEWNPEESQIGGSEEAVINITTQLAKHGYNVTVYCVLKGQPSIYDGVKYDHYRNWEPLSKQDITIIWRDPSNCLLNINSSKIFLDLHDTIPIKEIPENVKILVKSKFHASLINYNSIVIPNGIKKINYDTKKKGMMLCTSSPDRCLVGLLKMLPIIRKKIPYAEIHWAYGFKSGISKGGMETNPVSSEWVKIQKKKISETEGFVDYGHLSISEVEELYKQADIFIYPTYFPEIDCVSLSKAMSAGCIPIVSSSGSLSEKIGSSKQICKMQSDTIDYSLSSGKDFDDFIKAVIYILSNDIYSREDIINKSKDYELENVIKMWIDIINH